MENLEGRDINNDQQNRGEVLPNIENITKVVGDTIKMMKAYMLIKSAMNGL
jgi:hypothetical protein